MVFCLVIDDDPMACKIAADVAGSLGMQVRTELNGQSAINFCNDIMPDIIILDIQMPRLDGIGFLKELHRKIGGRRPYVIACTALNDVETVTTLKNMGIKGYLAKPFDASNLESKIRQSGLVGK